MKAISHGTVIAESDDTTVVEGNHYFPKASVNWDFFVPTDSKTRCYWKGVASYFDVKTDDGLVPDGAFTYERPLPTAKKVEDRVAFWKGIEVVE